jgi:hypothetical protein
MSKKKGPKRSERLTILYTPEEFQQLKKLFSRSVCKTVTGYAHNVSLELPVEILTRNASFDSFIEEIVKLRREMAQIRTLAFTPEREGQLIRLHDDIRTTINKIADLCMQQ